MKERIQFHISVHRALEAIDPQALSYDESEFWMIKPVYEYLEFYSLDNRLLNTAVALRLARGLHDGTHRKSSITKGGNSYRLPYVIHCLAVCRMLADLKIPLLHDQVDVMLAAALCHDMIEDIPFPHQGRELYEVYGLDPRVYHIVRLVSKRKDFTPEEEQAHFDAIAAEPLALLVKLSDRSHNVEDLYNMSVWKVHEYIGETRKYFLPMCDYGLAHYPHLTKPLELLRDKITSLTLVSETLVDRCEARQQELEQRLQQLREENARLRTQYSLLWQE